jgi:hypothetical protein
MEVKEGPCIVIALLVLPFDSFKRCLDSNPNRKAAAMCPGELKFYTLKKYFHRNQMHNAKHKFVFFAFENVPFCAFSFKVSRNSTQNFMLFSTSLI